MTTVPQALQIKTLPTVSNMKVETSILDPTTITENGCRFVLERKGILDTGSCIQLGVVTNTATRAWGNGAAFMPLRTGIHACIKSATLRIGSQIIAQSDNYNQYATMTRQFKTLEERQFKDRATKLTNDGLEPNNAGTGLYQPCDAIWASATSGSTHPQTKLTAEENTTPLGVIKLSELFPMARSLQLPLFAIHQPVVIEITWEKQGNAIGEVGKLCLFDPNHVPTDFGAKVALTQVKFLADYLTYSNDVMNEVSSQVMSDNGLTVPYDDLVLTTTTIPAAGVGTQIVSRDIGMSNMEVKSLMWADKRNISATQPLISGLMGAYYSSATYLPTSYNVRVNDRNIYNRDVDRESQQQNQLAQVMGVDMSVSRCEYSWDENVSKGGAETIGTAGLITNHRIAVADLNGVPCRQTVGAAISAVGGNGLQFEGMQHYCGIDLTTDPSTGAGTRVGQKPISLTRELRRVDNGAGTTYGNDVWGRNTFIWGKYGRVMAIRDGQVNTTR